ncbi:hypothetical protein [Chryseotalea sanaruensis]|nr:hypothetical protein [Chryseotalea sanaruensis]
MLVGEPALMLTRNTNKGKDGLVNKFSMLVGEAALFPTHNTNKGRA